MGSLYDIILVYRILVIIFGIYQMCMYTIIIYSFVLFPVMHTFMTFFDQIFDENSIA